MHRIRILGIPLLVLLSGVALLIAGTPYLHEQLFPAYAAQMNAARTAIDGEISRDAVALTNAVALASGDVSLRSAAENGMSDETKAGVEAALLPKVKLAEVAGGSVRVPVFGLLLDEAGAIVAAAGKPPALGDKLAGLPIFAEAKLGTVRDGFLAADGTGGLHLAAAPFVTDKGAVFVVLCGYPFDAAYVDSMSARVKVPTLMVTARPAKKIGTQGPEVDAATLATLVAEATFGLVEPELVAPVPGVPVLVPEQGRYVAGSVPAFRGGTSPSFVAIIDRLPAFSFLGNAQLVILFASLLLSLMVLLLTNSVYATIRRPIEMISDHLSQAAQGGPVGILPEAALWGPFERVGRQINMILQNPTGPRSSTGPITPVPQLEDSAPSGFAPGLANDPPPPEFSADPIPAGDAPVVPQDSGPLTPLTAAPVSEDLQNSSLSGLFDDGGADPLAAFRVGSEPAAPPVPPPAAQPPAASPLPGGGMNAPPPSKENYQPEATVAFQVPEELLQESADNRGLSAAIAPPPNTDAHAFDPGGDSQDRTVVAQIPSELLEQAAPKPEIDGDEAHYREVYEEFIQTRERCGEDTSQLTYDRFVAKLMKNRAAIMSKYNSKSVRFQVYVKQNKAALRAVPVRD